MATPVSIAMAILLGGMAMAGLSTHHFLSLLHGEPFPSLATADRLRPMDEVCVLAPRVDITAGGAAVAVVPISKPTIFAVGGFAVVRLERNGVVIWTLQASEENPIHGPIPWPVEPIQPGESFRLGLRPLGAGRHSYALIEIIGARAVVMNRSDALLGGLGADPATWARAVGDRLEQSDLALAIALLFAFEGPSGLDLDALRLAVFQHGCGKGAIGPARAYPPSVI